MAEMVLNPANSEAFAGKWLSGLSDAGVALLIGRGHPVGLLDLMAGVLIVACVCVAYVATTKVLFTDKPASDR